jgi:hypothetical protein
VRPRERPRFGAGDDRQPVTPRQRRHDVGHAGDHHVGARHQLEVTAVAGGPQRIDVGGREAPLAREVPGALPLAQEELDVRVGVQADTDTRQRLLVGAEIQVLGVDEDAVVVEKDRVERNQGSDRTFRYARMSLIRSIRYPSTWLTKL